MSVSFYWSGTRVLFVNLSTLVWVQKRIKHSPIVETNLSYAFHVILTATYNSRNDCRVETNQNAWKCPLFQFSQTGLTFPSKQNWICFNHRQLVFFNTINIHIKLLKHALIWKMSDFVLVCIINCKNFHKKISCSIITYGTLLLSPTSTTELVHRLRLVRSSIVVFRHTP